MGLLIDIPQPLKNCPSRPIWERRRGQVYLVFIDETFWQFFELRESGSFCHAAVGIPESEYAAVQNETEPIFERYCELLVRHKEFKHTEFKRIPFRPRLSLARSIHDILHAHGGFISAFYTPTRSFLMERARVNLVLAGRAASLPTHDPERLRDLLQEAASEVRAERTGPGMSAILTGLLHTPVSALLNFAQAIDIRLALVYDPREPRENRAVQAGIRRTAEAAGKLTLASPRRLLDVDITSASQEEVGLQYADLAAGETRAFLDANPELREHGASPNLITSTSDEPVQAIGVFKGKEYKFGAATHMPTPLRDRFFTADPHRRSVLPALTDLLLSGTITCYSTQGTPRHILPYDQLFIDQLD